MGQHTANDFVWGGKPLRTIGDLMDAMGALKDQAEAQEFIAAYRAADPDVADVNAGYLTGYFGHDDAVRLREWLGVAHPIFGNTQPSPEEAVQAGMRAAHEGIETR